MIQHPVSAVRSLIGLQICAKTWLLTPSNATRKMKPATQLDTPLRDWMFTA